MKPKTSGGSFFALPKFYWQLSDAQHVELARRRARWAKLIRWPLIAMWIGIVVGTFVLLSWIASTLTDTNAPAISEAVIWQGAQVGACVGFLMGMAVAIGIFFIYVGLEDGRRDELLVKLWDECQQWTTGEPVGAPRQSLEDGRP